MTQDNGGPAFPTVAGNVVYSNGMSLRDYFMAHAPVHLDTAMMAAGCHPTMTLADRPKVWAAMAIMRAEYADAMLAARKGES